MGESRHHCNEVDRCATRCLVLTSNKRFSRQFSPPWAVRIVALMSGLEYVVWMTPAANIHDRGSLSIA